MIQPGFKTSRQIDWRRWLTMAATPAWIFVILTSNVKAQEPKLDAVQDVFALQPKVLPASDQQPANSENTESTPLQLNASTGKVIEIQSNLALAKQLALREQRPILIVCGADWCSWCRKMELELQDDEADSILQLWIVCKVDVERQFEEAESLQVRALPALRVIDFQGSLLAKREGYLPLSELSEWLEQQYATANPASRALLYASDPPTETEIAQLIECLSDRSAQARAAAQKRLIAYPDLAASAVVTVLSQGCLAQKLAAIEILNRWNAPVGAIDPWVPETLTVPSLQTLQDWLKDLSQQLLVQPVDTSAGSGASEVHESEALEAERAENAKDREV